MNRRKFIQGTIAAAAAPIPSPVPQTLPKPLAPGKYLATTKQVLIMSNRFGKTQMVVDFMLDKDVRISSTRKASDLGV